LPSEILRSYLHIVPFPEDSLSRVVEIVGADRALLGSDYPHPEGLPAPLKMLERIGELSESDQRKVMGLNAARLMGLSDSDIRGLVENSPVAPLQEALTARA
jgi:predicted TIM-barrel fold metal-dependent hydrolase